MFSVNYRSLFNRKIKACYYKSLKSRFPTLPAICFSSNIRENTKNVRKPKFSRAQHGNFTQEKPKLYNPFLYDFPLQRFLNGQVPSEVSKYF